MKQITEEQIASVMVRAKHYATKAIKFEREYGKTKASRYKDAEDMYENQLTGLCVALGVLGIVGDSLDAFYQFLDEARSEMEEEK